MTDQQDNSQNPEDQSHAYHPNSRKIFVEGLPFQRTPQTDEALYALCAAVNIPSIIRLVQKKGYGFGYLLFKTESAAKLALKRLNGQELYGRSLRVEVPKEMHRTVPVQQASMEVGTLWRRQVLLLNIPYAVNAEILEEVLNDHLPLKVRAAVENIKLMRHGKAFVTFQDEGAVETLLAEYGGGSGGEKKKTMFVMGQELEVSRALPPTQTRGRPPTNESIVEAYSNKSKTVIAKRPREEDNDEQQQQVEEEHQHQQQQEENVAQPQQQPQQHVTIKSLDILIGGLPREMAVKEVRSLLEEQGCGVTKCSLIVSKSTGQPTGIARVSLKDKKSVVKALGVQGKKMYTGDTLVVEST